MLEIDSIIWTFLTYTLLILGIITTINYAYTVENDLKRINLELDGIVSSDTLVYNHISGIAEYDSTIHSWIPGRVNDARMDCRTQNNITYCGDGNNITRLALGKKGLVVIRD